MSQTRTVLRPCRNFWPPGAALSIARKRFAHVVLFQCPQCRGPLASAYSSSTPTLDTLDGGQFSAECCCGWSGNGLDFSAVNQSVQPWEIVETPATPINEAAGEYLAVSPDWLGRVAREIASLAEGAATSN
jgi:hypothetical protein